MADLHSNPLNIRLGQRCVLYTGREPNKKILIEGKVISLPHPNPFQPIPWNDGLMLFITVERADGVQQEIPCNTGLFTENPEAEGLSNNNQPFAAGEPSDV